MTKTCPICSTIFDENLSVCPSCGYHVLDATQSFQPVFGNGGAEAQNKTAKRFELKVVRGPQTGIDIALKPGMLKIGRDPQCDIFLNDMTVSRSHALLEVNENSCIIRDTNSFNGVWVNDRMEDACLLKAGDMLQIGAFCLMFRELPQ